MNNLITDSSDTDIFCYRFRTSRQKKRAQKTDFEKGLIAIKKEQKNIWQQQRNLGWEPIDPPYQRGWKRYFVLRDDVAKSRQANFYQTLLDKINTTDWSYRKDFMVKKRKFGRKKYVVKGQSLQRPYESQVHLLKLTDAELACFHEVWEYSNDLRIVKRFEVNEPWRFVLRVMPNMIDKRRKTDPLLESREKEIENYLDGNGYNHQLRRLDGGYKRWHRRYNEKKEHRGKLYTTDLRDLLVIAIEDSVI